MFQNRGFQYGETIYHHSSSSTLGASSGSLWSLVGHWGLQSVIGASSGSFGAFSVSIWASSGFLGDSSRSFWASCGSVRTKKLQSVGRRLKWIIGGLWRVYMGVQWGHLGQIVGHLGIQWVIWASSGSLIWPLMYHQRSLVYHWGSFMVGHWGSLVGHLGLQMVICCLYRSFWPSGGSYYS